MSKIYLVNITEELDGQECKQKVKESIFTKKSKLKEFIIKEGYYKESKNLYVKINNESILAAAIEKIKD